MQKTNLTKDCYPTYTKISYKNFLKSKQVKCTVLGLEMQIPQGTVQAGGQRRVDKVGA